MLANLGKEQTNRKLAQATPRKMLAELSEASRAVREFGCKACALPLLIEDMLKAIIFWVR